MYLRFSDIHESTSTGDNSNFLTGAINSEAVTKVVLFASPREIDKHESYNAASDGPVTNLPLLSAVAAFNSLPVIGVLFIVFDGLFLSAAKSSRQSEIDVMLGEAVKSEKVYFCSDRKPFTSDLSAEQAVEKLLAGDSQKLTSESRQILEKLLLSCNWKESLA